MSQIAVRLLKDDWFTFYKIILELLCADLLDTLCVHNCWWKRAILWKGAMTMMFLRVKSLWKLDVEIIKQNQICKFDVRKYWVTVWRAFQFWFKCNTFQWFVGFEISNATISTDCWKTTFANQNDSIMLKFNDSGSCSVESDTNLTRSNEWHIIRDIW
jgi:hypothetical protein